MGIKIMGFEIIPYINKPESAGENDHILRFAFADDKTQEAKYGAFLFSQDKMTIKSFAELVSSAMDKLIVHCRQNNGNNSCSSPQIE